MTPNVLAGIEKEREKIARGFGRKKTKRNVSTFYTVESIKTGYIKGKYSTRAEAQEACRAANKHFSRDEYKVGTYHANVGEYSVYSKQTVAIRKLASRAGVSFAIASAYYSGNGGNSTKALSAIRADQKRGRIDAGDYSFRKSKKRMKGAGLFDEMVLRRHSGGDKVKRIPKQFRKHPGVKSNPANPVPAAEERYQSFHGRPSERLVKVRTTLHTHDVLAGIGDLRKLRIKSKNGHWKVTVKFSKPYPILSMNEAATQLYIEGGDQSVNLKDFGIKTAHEKEVLGEVTDVWYFTTKDHLRPEDGGTAVYHHKFGRIKPTMIYDVPNELLEFAGGGYTIPDEGIDQ